jgi:hypothetical protein
MVAPLCVRVGREIVVLAFVAMVACSLYEDADGDWKDDGLI